MAQTRCYIFKESCVLQLFSISTSQTKFQYFLLNGCLFTGTLLKIISVSLHSKSDIRNVRISSWHKKETPCITIFIVLIVIIQITSIFYQTSKSY